MIVSFPYIHDNPCCTSSLSFRAAIGPPGGFGTLPPAPGLTGLLGTPFVTLPSSAVQPRRRGPSGPTDDLSLNYLSSAATFGLPVPVPSSSPKARVLNCFHLSLYCNSALSYTVDKHTASNRMTFNVKRNKNEQ